MKIFLASDHAGFELKQHVAEYLRSQGKQVQDLGPHSYVPEDDYTVTIPPAARAVQEDLKGNRAIVFGYSGQGEAMVCNKFDGIRAAVYAGGSEESVSLSRQHNDANVLSFGAKFVTPEIASRLAMLWLDTPFSGEERHARRIEALSHLK